VTPKKTLEIIRALGHENIQAVHPTTLMLTKDMHLSQTGDCIVGVASDKAIDDLSIEFKNKLKNSNAKLTILMEVDDLKLQITESGSQKLILSHPNDLVIRKSDYICNRTLAIRADLSSNDLPREFIEKLKNPKQEVKITLTVQS
jgi:uncharacterized protein